VREIAPGMKANLWGYNGQSPGPTLECVEGDRVRIFVTNRLPEHTTIHWHGILLPNGMDGVGGLTQPQIAAGKTFVYEFEMRKSGTFMYHPHADEMVQMAMGMMGAIVVHPRNPAEHAVERDYVFLINAYASSRHVGDTPRHLPAGPDGDARVRHLGPSTARRSRASRRSSSARTSGCGCAWATCR
jgi:FtsP/CotA-like multicopper oxidase with cupredoxin domain